MGNTITTLFEDNFDLRLRQLNITKAALCDKILMSRPTFNRYIKDPKNFTVEQIQILNKELDINLLEWIDEDLVYTTNSHALEQERIEKYKLQEKYTHLLEERLVEYKTKK